MFGDLFNWGPSRRKRASAVKDLVEALNTLDYDELRRVLTEDAVIVDAGGHAMNGIEDIVASDRAFREQANRPQVLIDTLDHTRDEVLVRGHMISPMPEVEGPLMWRAQFDGNRIARVEVTRPNDRMTGPLPASRRRAQPAF